MEGYSNWLTHFADGWSPAKGDFYSYNPLNMMARTLTCRDERWNCDYVGSCDSPCAHHVSRRLGAAPMRGRLCADQLVAPKTYTSCSHMPNAVPRGLP